MEEETSINNSNLNDKMSDHVIIKGLYTCSLFFFIEAIFYFLNCPHRSVV